MSAQSDRGGRAPSPEDGPETPDITDAPAEIGDMSDLAEAERLEEDRARREAETMPDLPDRAFDRITPQV